jgi:hypothetical protein
MITIPGVGKQLGAVISDSTLYMFIAVSLGGRYRILASTSTLALGSVTASAIWLTASIFPVSKPFVDSNGSIYFLAAYESTLQGTYFLVRFVSVDQAFIMSVSARGIAEGHRINSSHLITPCEVDTDVFKCTIGVKTQLISEDGTLLALKGIESLNMILNSSSDAISSQIGESLYIGGGLLMSYSGGFVFENGFLLYPEGMSHTVTGAGGSLSAGTYQYVVVFEWTDSNGELQRSATSLPYSITNSATDRNNLTIPTLILTEKTSDITGRSDVSIAIYRTIADGTVFYRITSATAPTLNDTKANTITYNDTASDASIETKEILYTTGGVLDNYPASGGIMPEKYRNRLYLVGSENGNSAQYSKKKQQTIAVEFTEEFEVRVDEGLGKIYAAKTLDEKLILFKKDGIWVHVGDGPLSTGDGSDFGDPQQISSDGGCQYPQSIASIPNGIIFKSDKGFLLLNRSLQVENIGEAVKDYKENQVTGATVDSDRNQVFFTHSDGPTLVYNYRVGEWSTSTQENISSSVLWKDTTILVDELGNVSRQTISSFKDAGQSYSLKIGTPWYSMSGLTGFKRIKLVQLLGQYKSRHNLIVRVYYDFRDDVFETFNTDTAEVLGEDYFGEDSYYGEGATFGEVDSQYLFELKPKKQKCTAIRFEIEDQNVEGASNEGYTLTGISFILGIKQGLNKMRDAKRMIAT